MEFKNEQLKTSFRLPEPFTVGDHDKWENRRFEVMQAGARTNLTVNFLAAMAIVEDWESELIPDPVDTIAEAQKLSEEQIAVVAWVGTVVITHVTSLMTVPKN
jgi:hypothetical protein